VASRRLYFRCTGGDFHDSVICPFDGWSAPEAADIVSAAAHLTSTGRLLSIESLRLEGISDAALHWVIVVDFGDEGSAFDALSPDQVGWPGWPEDSSAVTAPRRQMVLRLYSRCGERNGDDSVYSRIDAWSSHETKDIATAAARLTSTGRYVSIARLRGEGVSEAALRRVIVVDFGDRDAVFRFIHVRRSVEAHPPGDG
jgi:hypothetical protein